MADTASYDPNIDPKTGRAWDEKDPKARERREQARLQTRTGNDSGQHIETAEGQSSGLGGVSQQAQYGPVKDAINKAQQSDLPSREEQGQAKESKSSKK